MDEFFVDLPAASSAQRVRRRRDRGKDPQVAVTLPQVVIDQVIAWAGRTGRTKPGAWRELIVRGLETFEPVAIDVQFVKHKPHAPHRPRGKQGEIFRGEVLPASGSGDDGSKRHRRREISVET